MSEADLQSLIFGLFWIVAIVTGVAVGLLGGSGLAVAVSAFAVGIATIYFVERFFVGRRK